MTVEEYLQTVFKGPGREYLDGEIVERNFAGDSHPRAQAEILFRLGQFEAATGIYVDVERRHQVTPTRYRISDVAVFSSEPDSEIPAYPPLVSIEVLSPDDRIGYIIPKIVEYWRWGVANIWLAYPDARKLFVYGANGLHEVEQLELPQYSIVLTKDVIFS